MKWENPALLTLNFKDQAHGDCTPGSGDIGYCEPGTRAEEKCADGTSASLLGQGCLDGLDGSV